MLPGCVPAQGAGRPVPRPIPVITADRPNEIGGALRLGRDGAAHEKARLGSLPKSPARTGPAAPPTLAGDTMPGVSPWRMLRKARTT
jgi:hypothetical protein